MAQMDCSNAGSANSADYHLFYQSITGIDSADSSFVDIDNLEGLQHAIKQITSCVNQNFVLDFSDRHAWAGFDLTADALVDLIKRGGWPGQPSTRWIEISYPAKQKRLLNKLAQHYDFSPKLLAMMSSDPPGLETSKSPQSKVLQPLDQVGSDLQESFELEKGQSASGSFFASSSDPAQTDNLYELLEEVWHYTSIDQGSNYLCLGYNSIYPTGSDIIPYGRLGLPSNSPLPHCVRVWTWLILCNDRTVITITEDLFPKIRVLPSQREKAIMLRTKQNLLDVFRSLSLAEGPCSTKAILPIRKRFAEGDKAISERSREAPGLLFYYLFENWYNSYSLVTRRDSKYGKELQDIRDEMFNCPKLTQIDRLDQVGNELGVLKRHYKSYIRIIDRIIESTVISDANTLGSSQLTTRMVEESWDGDHRGAHHASHFKPTSLLGVDPGAAAKVRFERLKDQIALYALSEVKDYLAKKDNLVQMNFQLIAIKESRDVERLTRVSLFIAKATMLFLPISLMTGYFDVDLQGQSYTITTYWATFAGILVVSYVALVAFGIVSGTMESWPVMPPMRRLMDRAKRTKRSS
ncbi:hypothetical protein CAC42_7932 [Sphaceloma murrayae]|uniref:Uncharacterized protein n=1 Tax=Sphaceloma murrayae TaxID=2082308 RepID=A0A2K1QY41_9PEZI|nr:hypothetical protein CAC42_7932 [Sphaceloma murrayae]